MIETFNCLERRNMVKPIAIVLFLATAPALAVDLTKAKLPLHYECRQTLQSGLKFDENGNLTSGPFAFTPNARRFILERFEDTPKSRKNVYKCDRPAAGPVEDRQFTGNGIESREFCLTELFELPPNHTHENSMYCSALPHDGFGTLTCLQSVLFDTDRLWMVRTISLFNIKTVGYISTSVYDCKRLDR